MLMMIWLGKRAEDWRCKISATASWRWWWSDRRVIWKEGRALVREDTLYTKHTPVCKAAKSKLQWYWDDGVFRLCLCAVCRGGPGESEEEKETIWLVQLLVFLQWRRRGHRSGNGIQRQGNFSIFLHGLCFACVWHMLVLSDLYYTVWLSDAQTSEREGGERNLDVWAAKEGHDVNECFHSYIFDAFYAKKRYWLMHPELKISRKGTTLVLFSPAAVQQSWWRFLWEWNGILK